MEDIFTRIEQAQNGDRQAMQDIVTENSGLIWSVVKKFPGCQAENDDLFQIGAIGLMKAVKRFDTTFQVKFSTYAVPMILGEIRRFIRDDGMIKVSRNIKENSYKLHVAREVLGKKLGREPTLSELSENTGLAVEDIVTALDAAITPESLNSKAEGEDRELMDKIPGKTSVEAEIISKVDLKDALSSIQPRERQIIMLRYFSDKTQSQIAGMLGISQVQVSRIEKKVLEKLRNKIS